MNCPLCSSSEKITKEFKNSTVYICKNCSLEFLEKQQDSDYYQNYCEHFDLSDTKIDELRDIQYSIHAEHIKKNISKGNLLDVGCSSGELLSRLKNDSNYDLFGIDPDKLAIDSAKQKYGSKITFSDSYLTNFESNKTFDAFIFRGTFQYLGNELISSMKKIKSLSTKSSKILMYSIPNSDSFLYHFLGENWHMFHKLEHTLIFNRLSILKLCEIFNYKLIELSYPYLETPYANPKKDYENLIDIIHNKKTNSFPFWGNIFQAVLEKN